MSHDRDFLDGLVDKVYEFGGGKVREHLGGIYDFLQSKQLSSLQELERKNSLKQSPLIEEQSSTGKLSYAEKKERERLFRKAEKKLAEAEKVVESLEIELSDIEAKLASGTNDNDLFLRHGDVKKKLENAMSEWELAGMELEYLKDK